MEGGVWREVHEAHGSMPWGYVQAFNTFGFGVWIRQSQLRTNASRPFSQEPCFHARRYLQPLPVDTNPQGKEKKQGRARDVGRGFTGLLLGNLS